VLSKPEDNNVNPTINEEYIRYSNGPVKPSLFSTTTTSLEQQTHITPPSMKILDIVMDRSTLHFSISPSTNASSSSSSLE
jgi:hypothetical protein